MASRAPQWITPYFREFGEYIGDYGVLISDVAFGVLMLLSLIIVLTGETQRIERQLGKNIPYLRFSFKDRLGHYMDYSLGFLLGRVKVRGFIHKFLLFCFGLVSLYLVIELIVFLFWLFWALGRDLINILPETIGKVFLQQHWGDILYLLTVSVLINGFFISKLPRQYLDSHFSKYLAGKYNKKENGVFSSLVDQATLQNCRNFTGANRVWLYRRAYSAGTLKTDGLMLNVMMIILTVSIWYSKSVLLGFAFFALYSFGLYVTC